MWNHKQLLKVASHTPIGVETLQRFSDAHGQAKPGQAGACRKWRARKPL